MPKKRTNADGISSKRRPPARTLEARESQMVSLAIDLAEKQLMEGTASSQVITHYLKLGSTMEREKKEIMREQKKLLAAKTEAIESSRRIEELMGKALSAMKTYSGANSDDDSDIFRID